MLDLFLKLIEKLVDLAKEKQRIRRSFHDNFVFPFMKQFENVHQEYISSFQTYRKLITEEAPTFTKNNGVFEKLESDMIYSHSSREKLMAMSDGIRSLVIKYNWSGEDKIGIFILSLSEYIESISDSAGDRYRNAPRGSLLELLRDIAVDNWHREGGTPSQDAEKEILEKMREMQDLYSNIQNTYQQAKTEMLN